MSLDFDSAVAEAESLIGRTEELVRVVLTGARRRMAPPASRIDIRPVSVKGEILLQVAENDGRQTTTRNCKPNDLNIKELLTSGFANILVEHTDGSISIRATKKHGAQVHREKKELRRTLSHDRSKSRLLDSSDPFLKEVGISDSEGIVKPSRQDKYRQVEEFLRLLAPSLESAIESGHVKRPTELSPLEIVDLGCGNAYLTFAVHQYLRKIGMPIRVVGIDIREESRRRNSAIADKLGISTTMEFRAEEIAKTTQGIADVVIALHACDTATDDAIAWGVLHDAKLLFIAPCCHHDLQVQIRQSPDPWQIVTKHGLLKERLADLMTDALRAQILKLVGYRAEVIEFVGGEHTPRNILIRAVKTGALPDPIDRGRYDELLDLWNVKPALANRLSTKLNADIK